MFAQTAPLIEALLPEPAPGRVLLVRPGRLGVSTEQGAVPWYMLAPQDTENPDQAEG